MPALAWLRNGNPIQPGEVERAAGRFRVAIVQPWEEEAAARLSASGTTVLAYQCLSSIRVYEQGPRYSSGITHDQAQRLSTTTPAEWAGYPGHFQQEVWREDYRAAWTDNVAGWVADSPFDGVFADNDVATDFYGHGFDMALVRRGLDQLITQAGTALSDAGKKLVPNIAEARLYPGRWQSHARFGGGFEECLFAWGTRPDERLALAEMVEQTAQLHGPGLSIARVPGKGKALQLALAAAWVFAPTADVAVTATVGDHADAMPIVDTPDLGDPLTARAVAPVPGVYARDFTAGRAVVNLSEANRMLDGEMIPAFSGVLVQS